MSLSVNDHVFLPEDDKLLRLQECDFHSSIEVKNDNKKFNLLCTLKTIKNPILILFHYNDTKKNILTEWYEASRKEKYENGQIEDFIFPKDVKEEDMKFKFGSVNLSYENNLDKAFMEIDKASPFVWVKADNDIYYSFVLFYYQTYPQLSYEGNLNNFSIQHEFSDWRKDFTDMDSEKVRKESKRELERIDQKYFQATDDTYISAGIINGNLYKITLK